MQDIYLYIKSQVYFKATSHYLDELVTLLTTLLHCKARGSVSYHADVRTSVTISGFFFCLVWQ